MNTSYFDWVAIPVDKCKKNLNIRVIKKSSGFEQWDHEKDELLFKVFKIDKRIRITLVDHPEEYRIDAIKFTYTRQKITFFDVAAYIKYSIKELD